MKAIAPMKSGKRTAPLEFFSQELQKLKNEERETEMFKKITPNISPNVNSTRNIPQNLE